jgi:hypothetical protein
MWPWAFVAITHGRDHQTEGQEPSHRQDHFPSSIRMNPEDNVSNLQNPVAHELDRGTRDVESPRVRYRIGITLCPHHNLAMDPWQRDNPMHVNNTRTIWRMEHRDVVQFQVPHRLTLSERYASCRYPRAHRT